MRLADSQAMAAAGAGRAAAARGEPSRARIERHLLVLMASRLALSVAGLVIALGLDALSGNVTVTEWHGFYGAVALAFVATLIYWPLAGHVRRIEPFAAANIALDLVLVSALVSFSGGSDSVFTFLYVLVPAYAAVLLSGRGAMSSAALAGVAYGAVVGLEGWTLTAGGGGGPSLVVMGMRWLVLTGAMVLVAALASLLVAELERAGRALDETTSDLEELRTLHERTVESLRSGLLTTDEAGRVTSFNREAEQITSLSREEACGAMLEAILPGAAAVIGSAEAGDGRSRARMQFHSCDGRSLHLGVGAYALRDSAGVTRGRVVIFQDVSDVVQMERDLRRSERLAATGTLAASIAHEIRNPLAAISGSIQLLQRTASGLEREPARLMEIVVREVDRLNHLITDFLAYARPAPLQTVEVAVAELIEEVGALARPALREELVLEVSCPADVRVMADPGRLRQVLWNLLLNAAEATPREGRLRVEVTRAAAPPPQEEQRASRMDPEGKAVWAEIAVMDQGAGIPAEIAERVFDPFFTTKRGGSGLGLPTVHRIALEHGGYVRLESGVGPWSTVVRVRLPMPEAA